jgi:flagellar hook-basal body complex protein FliE
MAGIGAVGGVSNDLGPVTSAEGVPSGSAAPFSGIFKSMVDETNELSAKAQTAVTGLLSGSGVDVHQAMIATQKADVAFELALQVRNKAIGAYQTMMGMQF